MQGQYMAGTFVISDDACWIPAGWVHNKVMELVANELAAEHPLVEKQMLDARTSVSVGYVDLRTSGDAEFRAVVNAADAALAKIEKAGPTVLHDPSFFPGFVERVHELQRMLQTELSEREIRRGVSD
jgi:hypothetical protein